MVSGAAVKATLPPIQSVIVIFGFLVCGLRTPAGSVSWCGRQIHVFCTFPDKSRLLVHFDRR